MDRCIIHVDMDAFFASIEQRDNPKLKDKPVVVGGLNSRGVVSTASYEARKYGIYSSMPISKAKRLCPNAIFLPVNMKKYKRVSQNIYNIFSKYTKEVEPISIDEAFLDITGKDVLFIVKKIKQDIKNNLSLTASIGISINKFLAKLASDIQKPNGLTIIKKEDIFKVLKPLSIRKLWGVGIKTQNELNKLGIYTIGDLQNYSSKVLIDKFGKRGKELIDFSKGIDDRLVEPRISCKSIGEEETFYEDVGDLGFLLNKLREYSKNLSCKLIYKEYLARTVTVKVKYSDFNIETRSLTLNIPTDKYKDIFEISKYIINNKFILNKKVRLLGLSVSNFIYPYEPIQLNFYL